MNTCKSCFRSLLFPLLAACTLGAAERPAENSTPRSFVIGLSPYLDKSVKDDVYRGIVRLVVEGLPLDSRLDLYDAFDLKTITHVTVPNQRAFNSPKTRANQFASAIGELKQFLAAEHPRPAEAKLKFNSALRLPQFYDFLAGKSPAGTPPAAALLLGSPLYQDAREPGFSMVNGYFPSDGHLLATKQESVYGLGDTTNALPGLAVHWVCFGDPWLNELYKERVTRFWTLYLAQRGARLVSFSSDLPTGFESFGASNPPAPAGNWSIAAGDTKVEMLRISRSVDAVDWLTRGALTETSTRPPRVMVGPMKIGIRWQDNIDLDLYATPRPGAETLYFQHPHSTEGYYYKDHRSSPGREYEFIEFEMPVDIREVEAYVNFYKGSCPGGPQGEVRVEFDGQIYGATFALAAPRGNRGRTGEDQRDYWTRLPLQEILKLRPALSAR